MNAIGLQRSVPDLLVAAMYMLSGIGNFFGLRAAAEGLRKRTFGRALPLSAYVAAVAVSSAALVAASGAIAVTAITDRKRKMGGYAALYLVIFTVLATAVYHWPPVGSTYYPFISNITAIGGLLILARCRLSPARDP